MKKTFYTIIISSIILFCSTCSVNVSLSGASIPPGSKTISVEYFQNNADLVNPTLARKITQELKDKFNDETRLLVVSKKGDLHFQGVIKKYTMEPQMVGEGQATQNRLQVTVEVNFTNKQDEKLNYIENFTQYEDYNSSMSNPQAETTYLPKIIEKLVDDIYKRAVANW